jgi:hypothetical protein
VNLAARIGVRSFAVDAVATLEQYLTMLLGVADVLASQGNKVASNELRRALERSIRVLHVLREELAAIAVIEDCVRAQQATPS